jgi:glycosyltransferase involved in cell wall biosynthesis
MTGPAERPGHVALLLNNPFVADSRSWKLATGLAAAGWRVTVVARAGTGLPEREERDGYVVLRVARPRPLAWLPAPGLPRAGPDQVPPGSPSPESAADRGTHRWRVRARLRDSLGRALQAVRYLRLARGWADSIARALPYGADIWQSEGLVALPTALRLRGRLGGRVVYDSRDIGPESARFARLPGPWRRLLARRERAWARAADALVTVNLPYADHLRRTVGRSATVVFNGPVAFDPPIPSEHRFHDRLGLPPATRVILALGAVVAHRGIETAARAMADVPNAVLVVVGNGEARDRIQAEARTLPHAARVAFMNALPPDELLGWTAAADVALMPIQPSTLNHRLTTPTRLFDAMGAGVPVVAADLPGMAAIVRETGIGVLVDPMSPDDIARGLRDVLDAPPEQRAAYREACLAAARGPYAWQRQLDRLLDLYRSVLGGAPG